jgi:hypothetical protein
MKATSPIKPTFSNGFPKWASASNMLNGTWGGFYELYPYLKETPFTSTETKIK